MPSKGNFLKTNEILQTNEYLASANGVYFAIQQNDGNFCVYRGSGPDANHGYLWGSQKLADGGTFFAVMQSDGNFCVYKGTGHGDNRGYVWGSQKTASGDQFFAIVQDDGNFCVYRGTGPADNRGHLWGSQVTDSVQTVEIDRIEYELGKAKTISSEPARLYRQTVKNETSQEQTSVINGSEGITETSRWSNSLAVAAGASTTFKTGIPLLAEGQVTVSLEVTNTYTWEGSVSREKRWGFEVPVTVPPHSSATVLVAATLSKITVPYKLTGTLVLKSGARVPGTIRGTYEGANSHDLNVTYSTQSAATGAVQQTSRRLHASELTA